LKVLNIVIVRFFWILILLLLCWWKSLYRIQSTCICCILVVFLNLHFLALFSELKIFDLKLASIIFIHIINYSWSNLILHFSYSVIVFELPFIKRISLFNRIFDICIFIFFRNSILNHLITTLTSCVFVFLLFAFCGVFFMRLLNIRTIMVIKTVFWNYRLIHCRLEIECWTFIWSKFTTILIF